MEISSISTNPRPYFSSTESLLSKSVNLPSWKQHLLSISSYSRAGQPLLRRILRSSMDEVFDTLAERILPTSAVALYPNAKHIVGLAGPPGAGKSTLAVEVRHRINKLRPQKACSFDSRVKPPDVAVVIPIDGFHLYRFQLGAMENPEEANARRGAQGKDRGMRSETKNGSRHYNRKT